jgi:hypothetical protein
MLQPAIKYITILLVGITLNVHAALIELLPGQFNPSDHPLTAISLQHTRTDYVGNYVNAVSNNKLKMLDQETSLTLLHFNRIKDTPVLAGASLGWRDYDYSKPYHVDVSGVTDAKWALGFWPWVDRKNHHHIGVALVGSVPTGNYHQENSVNISENRYRASLVLNAKLSLSDHWQWETFALYNWATDNDAYRYPASGVGRLSQNPTASVTSYLAYQSKQHINPFIGLEKNMGANQYWNNTMILKAQDDLRASVGFSLPINHTTAFSFRYGQTVDIETGSKQEQQLLLRLSYLF